jgi:hypothetical protein
MGKIPTICGDRRSILVSSENNIKPGISETVRQTPGTTK